MALKILIFGTDDLYPKLKPLYEREVRLGNLKIVAEVDSFNDACAAADFDLAKYFNDVEKFISLHDRS